MADSKTVVILGGGRRRCGDGARAAQAPSGATQGRARRYAITRPLAGLARKGIDVRIGNVEHIDPDRRLVTVAGQAIAADYLVITLGAELAPRTIPGPAEAGHNSTP